MSSAQTITSLVSFPAPVKITFEDPCNFIGRLRDALVNVRGGLMEAGRVLVEAIDTDPVWRTRILESNPGCTPQMLKQLELIGRRLLDPRVVPLGSTPSGKVLRRLPIEEQTRILDGGMVDMVTEGGDVMKVDVRNMTVKQASLVIGPDRVRGIAEQRALLMAPTPRPAGAEGARGHVRPTHHIIPGRKGRQAKLVVGGVVFTESELVNNIDLMRSS